MRQVFYIDTDEEIISVIGRLRHSPSRENVIVAPKRALIFQSVVNLRLLQHDARKNNKDIIVVTQDRQGSSLCEKLNIKTQPVLDEEDNILHQSLHSSSQPEESGYRPQQMNDVPNYHSDEASDEEGRQKVRLPHSGFLGSTDFSGGGAVANVKDETVVFSGADQANENADYSQQEELYSSVKKIAVRDKNPKRFTTLNSQRQVDEMVTVRQEQSFVPPSLRNSSGVSQAQSPLPPLSPIIPPAAPQEAAPSPVSSTVKTFFAKDYFQNQPRQAPAPAVQSIPKQERSLKWEAPQKKQEKPDVPQEMVHVPKGSFGLLFIVFGIISALLVAGVGAYLVLPEADIDVTLKAVTQKGDFEFQGMLDAKSVSVESKTIPMRLIEKEEDIVFTSDATGKTERSDQKSRGTVTIYNGYSADSQLLVASTRLQSSDGKVFRLLSNVTVPGMIELNGKQEPGAIEATVIADQSGGEYDIVPTTFTIPGFEGSPKYSKFSAKSMKAMAGGSANGSEITVISEKDIASAKKKSEEKTIERIQSVISGELKPGEKVLDGAIEKVIVSSSSSPQVGAVANVFEYRSKVKIRAFVFSEDALKESVATLFKGQSVQNGDIISAEDIKFEYGEPTPEFNDGTLRIKVHAVGNFEPSFDKEQLKADVSGRSDSDMEALLQKYPQIENISFHLSPELFVHTVPTREDRINISVRVSE